MNRLELKTQWSSITRVIRWAMLDAAIGCACAALYGILFAGFDAAIHSKAGQFLATVGYFAVCGAIAGGLVGTFGALTDFADARKPTGACADKLRDTAVVVIPVIEAPQDCERISRIALVSRSRREVLEAYKSRILIPKELSRARKPYDNSFVDSVPSKN